ncbi:MAG: TetR/AcrR family transcriptional regulator [Lachnospiraceae bacterium]|nr:TetR/AcrR family transcriptional regulator [Lachnospiraceae bacterium]
MSLEKKRLFVEATYKILKEEGPEGIKIRRLAKELNCTSTVIYRYFDNLDHLIALASIRFFNEYIIDFRNMVSDPQILTDPYGLNLRMWDCLAEHACKNIPIYENLFFGKYQHSLGEVIFEYYQLFLDDSKQDFDGYSVSILFNDDLFQRDFVLLRRAAALGTITIQEAASLSQIECHIFRGVLLKYIDDYKKPGIPQKAAAEFSKLIHELADRYR